MLYLPNHAVAPLLYPRPEQTITADHIVDWAGKTFPSSASDRAVISYLQSTLIEHFQSEWSNSSRAERLLLYHFAWGHVPNLATAYAVRSLVRRGLVVLDPYPRISSRSFAQFVRHVEKPTTLQRWRKRAESGMWQALKTPIFVIVPAAFLVLAVVTVRNGDSLWGLLPLLVAAGPALFQAFGSPRRVAPG